MVTWVIVELTSPKGGNFRDFPYVGLQYILNKSITQDMAYRQSLMKYAEKYGVSRASRKYNKSRSYIYF